MWAHEILEKNRLCRALCYCTVYLNINWYQLYTEHNKVLYWTHLSTPISRLSLRLVFLHVSLVFLRACHFMSFCEIRQTLPPKQNLHVTVFFWQTTWKVTTICVLLFTCPCGLVYAGQTTRALEICTSEHKTVIYPRLVFWGREERSSILDYWNVSSTLRHLKDAVLLLPALFVLLLLCLPFAENVGQSQLIMDRAWCECLRKPTHRIICVQES